MQAPITVEDLERWLDGGATWRPLELADDHAMIELCTCYGEAVDTAHTHDPAVIEFLRAHPPV